MGGLTAEHHNVDGVCVYPLRQIPDERGMVMHMLRADASHFEGFGEVYFSLVKSGKVKAWKRHRHMAQNIAVPVGAVRFVIYDDRPDSPTRGELQIIEAGQDNYALIHIPPMVWYGFQGIGSNDNLLANCAPMTHDPAESERREPDDPMFPYTWQEGGMD